MLLILDGWGYRQPVTPDNAIENGHTPNWHSYLKEYPHSLIETYGLAVGLPEGQMGNSEVGHMNLGAGRVVMQDLPRIDQAIKDGSIKENPVLKELIADLQKNGKTCHLMGLMSPGGVHSSMNHIVALCRILSENKVKVDVHAFLDGRDTPPSSAQEYLAEFEKDIAAFNGVKIATISGRFYAMDRDKRWDRVEAAYNAIALGEGKHAASADEAIAASYKDGVTDEFVVPCVIGDYKGFEEGDAVLMANFRADRALDQYLADPMNENFELPEEVLAELTRTSHRHYSPGFYFGREQARQATDSATYIREWEFVGTVDGWENGVASCQQRGKWSLGDTLEVLCPDGRSIPLDPEWIKNESGELMESTPHAMERYTIPTPELPPMSLLRRKV